MCFSLATIMTSRFISRRVFILSCVEFQGGPRVAGGEVEDQVWRGKVYLLSPLSEKLFPREIYTRETGGARAYFILKDKVSM